MIVRLLILLAAVVPPLLVLGYGIAKGRGSVRSEATWNAFFVGAMSAIAAVVGGYLLRLAVPVDRMDALAGAATSATVLAAIPEEAIKYFVLVCIAEKHVDVRRMQDRLVLALAVSIGFATLENFFYLAAAADWKTIASLRAMTAVPGHGINGLVMGALLIAGRLDRHAVCLRMALFVPMVLHAAYDFPLFAINKHVAPGWFAAGWVLVLVLSSVFAIVLANRILARAVEFDRTVGRDGGSVETSDRLIVAGIAALLAGPLLAIVTFYAKGFELAPVAIALSIFPVALGPDSIRTGIKRRAVRNAQPSAAQILPPPAPWGGAKRLSASPPTPPAAPLP